MTTNDSKKLEEDNLDSASKSLNLSDIASDCRITTPPKFCIGTTHSLTDESITPIDDSSIDESADGKFEYKLQSGNVILHSEVRDQRQFAGIVDTLSNHRAELSKQPPSKEGDNLEVESAPDIPRETLRKSFIRSPLVQMILQKGRVDTEAQRSQTECNTRDDSSDCEKPKSDLLTQNNSLKKTLKQMQDRLASLQSEIVRERSKAKSYETNFMTLHDKFVKLKEIQNENNKTISMLANKLDKAEQHIVSLTNENTQIRRLLEYSKTEIYQLRGELAELDIELGCGNASVRREVRGRGNEKSKENRKVNSGEYVRGRDSRRLLKEKLDAIARETQGECLAHV